MKPVEIKNDIYWVGAVDWDVRDFHGYSTYKGTTYNAYLAKDEKVALFDTVKKPFYSDLLHRIYNIMKPSDIDYLVVNHMEMDHSGSLKKAVEAIKPEKIYTSVMGAKSMAAHYNVENWPVEVVKTGDSLRPGSAHHQLFGNAHDPLAGQHVLLHTRGEALNIQRRLWAALGHQ